MVIYNDYDNFLRRLELIDTTEEIRKGLLRIVGADSETLFKLSNIPYNKLGRTLAIGNNLDLMLFSKV